jgi:FkbH-like protein
VRHFSIAVAATFSAEPIRRSLAYWMELQHLQGSIHIAPGGRILSDLYSPASPLRVDDVGVTVILLRAQDLLYTADQVLSALGLLARSSSRSICVILCPSSPLLVEAEQERHILGRLQQGCTEFQACCLTYLDIERYYPCRDWADIQSERLAGIPYTEAYFAALGTMVARFVRWMIASPYKAIVVDCDNTLWTGACSEKTPEELQLTAGNAALQEFLVARRNAGMLLCICSRNNEDDVRRVFNARTDMRLRYDQITASRINWQSKPENLRSLSRQLNIDLSGFIFLDDSPIECAQVQAHCPQLLVLQVCPDGQDMLHFLNHVWAFDDFAVTREAAARPEQYRQQALREDALSTAASFDEFIAALQLRVNISAAQTGDLPRISELTQRVNQFHTNGRRLRVPQLRQLLDQPDFHALAIRATDRFGDHGLIGAALYRDGRDKAALVVELIVISCRVLERGIESSVLRELGCLAEQQGASTIEVVYQDTGKNRAASTFLARILDLRPAAQRFAIATEAARRLPLVPPLPLSTTQVCATARLNDKPAPQLPPLLLAPELGRLSDIVDAMNIRSPAAAGVSADHLPAAGDVLLSLTERCRALLKLPSVVPTDNFFDLGGESLDAVRLIAQMRDELQMDIPLHTLFDAPDFASLALLLGRERTRPRPTA